MNSMFVISLCLQHPQTAANDDELADLVSQHGASQSEHTCNRADDQRIEDIADRVLWLEDGEFKEAVTMAVDPVCGMSIEREKAINAEWEGQVYSFCARGCRDEFMNDPHKFIAVS